MYVPGTKQSTFKYIMQFVLIVRQEESLLTNKDMTSKKAKGSEFIGTRVRTGNLMSETRARSPRPALI